MGSGPVSTVEFWRRGRGEEFLAACYETTPESIRRSFDVEEAFVRENLPSSGRVLEVGCGSGRFLARLGTEGARRFGCDLVEGAVGRARALLGAVPLCAADASALPYEEGSFDAVFCIQASLGNFGDRKDGALKEMARVLRAGGVLLLTVYAESALPDRLEWYRRLEGNERFGRIDPARTRGSLVVTTTGWASEGFERGALESMIRRAGLEPRIENREPILHLVRATRQARDSRGSSSRRGRAGRSSG
ncbi:MAG TPA: class I SAM-dependent methyltransferase [Planctomycetota bacterium]|nr:class I SAM-dependent methyltransferase [Planctomycetota bacterium]